VNGKKRELGEGGLVEEGNKHAKEDSKEEGTIFIVVALGVAYSSADEYIGEFIDTQILYSYVMNDCVRGGGHVYHSTEQWAKLCSGLQLSQASLRM